MRFLHGTGLEMTADDLRSLNQDQNRAIIEAFLTSLAADGKVNETELQAFGVSLQGMPWNFPANQLEDEVVAVAKALEALDKDKLPDHFRALGGRLPTDGLREKAFAGMFALMIADGEFDEAEQQATAGFAKLFGIADERTVTILTTVVDALKKAIAEADQA
jgi:uncharacterized tellurite resistance protein B-like protein